VDEKLKQKLTSNQFKAYLQALKEIRKKLDKGEKLNIDDQLFEHICKIYFFYKTGPYDDLSKLQKEFMDILYKRTEYFTKYIKDKTISRDTLTGPGTYTEGCLVGQYDESGFQLSFGNYSLEICASAEIKKLVKILEKDFPEDAELFREYANLLKSIEGAYHTVYWILRHIANQHIKKLKVILLLSEPIFKSYILHAMDAFVGDPGIINLYKEYIALFAKIKAKSDKAHTIKECDALIAEAQKYLSTVE
jgi:hypothetical protein